MLDISRQTIPKRHHDLISNLPKLGRDIPREGVTDSVYDLFGAEGGAQGVPLLDELQMRTAILKQTAGKEEGRCKYLLKGVIRRQLFVFRKLHLVDMLRIADDDSPVVDEGDSEYPALELRVVSIMSTTAT